MLFLIATPIGNLKDFTLRAMETLHACDYVLCEDTRRTSLLLKHHSIRVPLKSFHLFNEASRENRVIDDLKSGKKIGLLSDAGTPGISDPGERLVRKCRSEGIEVTPIPGPCAAIAALSASGLPTSRFQFLGFLPKKKGKLKRILEDMLSYPGTSICYESPFRLVSTLKILADLDQARECTVAREITKKFESFLCGPPLHLLTHFTKHTPKGEIVLLIRGIEK
jgi:16S rRNA (cytidine1402-2'-O)-methyltransferase